MAQTFLVCLILADVLVGLAMANEKLQTTLTDQSKSSSDPPAPSPTNGQNMVKSEAPVSRKIGRHRHHQRKVSVPDSPTGSPTVSPSVAPGAEDHNTHSRKENSSSSDQTYSGSANISIPNQGQEVHLKRQHHSVDKSIAGGGVILGCLATTFLVAVFCYIRATGKHKAEATY